MKPISNELIHPAREKNALLEVATAFLFKTSPSATEVQQFQKDLSSQLEVLGFGDVWESSLNAIQLEFTAAGPGTGELLPSEYGGFQMFKKQDAQPEWLVKFNRVKDEPGSFLVISCFLYDSWNQYVDFLQRVLKAMPANLDHHEVDRIGFVCTDGFSVGPCEDPMRTIFETVLDPSSQYIPKSLFETTGEWSFSASTVGASPIKRVDKVQNNINASVSQTQDDTAVFKLTHVQEFQLGGYHVLSTSRDDVYDIIHEAHGKNKVIMESVLRSGLSQQIGLTP